MNSQRISICMAGIVTVSVLSVSAHGQTLLGGNFANENITGPQLRAPGNMIGAGLARAQDFVDRGHARPVITETEDTSTPTPQRQFVNDSLQVIFDQLSALVDFFVNRLAARAGLPAVSSGDSTTSTSTSGVLDNLIQNLTGGNTPDTSTTTTSETKGDTSGTNPDRGNRTSRKSGRT